MSDDQLLGQVTTSDEPFYQPQDAIGNGISYTVSLGAAGLFLSAVQNSMSKQNLGAFGVFTRFGATTALLAAVGGSYAFVSTASANLRQKNDFVNDMIGGFTAGAVLGLQTRTLPSVIGRGAAFAIAMGVAQYTGNELFGQNSYHPEEDRWPTKEQVRKRFRRPVNETINELGEGRGIYGPGYDERRRERLKQNYGLDVPKPFWEDSTIGAQAPKL